MNIKITKTTTPKQKPDFSNLGFGQYFSDHMFVMEYSVEKGWHDPQIMPYSNLSLDPACMVFHYGQELFEGMKAYRADDGRILLFRPDMNAKRSNSSCRRLAIPEIPVEDYVEAVDALVKVDNDWVPSLPGTSLYIRPFIIATQANLGVHASFSYKFIIILSPVGAYYKEGLNPVRIFVETEYVRAARGGIGFTKAGGNYAASIIAQAKASENGYAQVLWLDANERKYIEEVGTMNVMFKIGGEVITPALGGSILPGITRDSIIALLKSMNVPISERQISIDEVIKAHEDGTLEEVFGTGTAAVISPVGELSAYGKQLIINGGKIGELSQKLYDTLTGIQWGSLPDDFGWTYLVK